MGEITADEIKCVICVHCSKLAGKCSNFFSKTAIFFIEQLVYSSDKDRYNFKIMRPYLPGKQQVCFYTVFNSVCTILYCKTKFITSPGKHFNRLYMRFKCPSRNFKGFG